MKKDLSQPVYQKILLRKIPSFLLQIFLMLIVFTNNTSAQAPVDPSSIIGKVVCGYQGWFTCTGDSSPINRWTHWAPTNAPQAGVAPNPNPNLTFDAYPDVSIYNPSSLFQTNFANQGNGAPAKLFSSYKQDVTDKHFELMQTNGIDGVAFQRFIWEVLVDPAFKANRDTMAVHVRKSAEKYQRMFYLVYDLSGLGNVPAANDQARFDAIKNDWTANMIGNLQFTSSPMYAKQGGKPVVQLWGIGYNHIIGSAAIQLDLINWFKAQGCYVIIGVPTGWRTGTGASNAGWINTYKAGNMISPWSVGAYTNQATTDNFKTSFLTPDLTYCNTNGIAYQPVIFPGFSWYNWNGGTQNQISRNKGEFLWHQAANLRALNITSAEIAMMDEYDEGTAILPMADGYNMIPTNQYFVTTSADGTYLSTDFYLRLAGKATRQINKKDAVIANVPIPYSAGPIFFRTSNESKYDPMPTWVSSTDLKANVTAYGSNSGNPVCTNIAENPHAGQYAMKITGRDRSATSSYAYFKVWQVSIPVSSTTELSFWNYPLNALGRYISVDLVMTDGTTLRDCGAVDSTGVSMHPAAGRGIINAWTKTKSNIGTWLNGKTIAKIMIAYDHASQTGDFSGYVDDLSINTAGATLITLSQKPSFSAKAFKTDVQLALRTFSEKNVKAYEIERSIDDLHYDNIETLAPSNKLDMNEYAVIDANAVAMFSNASRIFYRVKTIDKSGKFSYSKIVSIKNDPLTQKVFILTNPFDNAINIKFASQPKDKVFFKLFNTEGQLVLKEEFKNPGNTIMLRSSSIKSKGLYILETEVDGRKFVDRVVKK